MDGFYKLRKLLGKENKHANFGYDMGFVLEPRIENEMIPGWLTDIKKEKSLIGLNVSGLLYIGGYSGKNMFRLKGNYRKIINSIIEYFIHKHNVHIMLVPHVLGGVDNIESDVLACHSVFWEINPDLQNHLHIINDGYDHHELKAIIGECNFFLGSRMHACIAALSQGIPSVGLAYSNKFKGVFESVGMQELLIDLRDHDHCAVVELIDKLYCRCHDFHEKLMLKMPEVRSSVLSLFAEYTR